MLKVSQSCRVEIDRGDIFRMARTAGRTIECEQGAIWITLDDDPRDVVLNAGERYRVEQRERMLVSALGPGAFTVSAEPCGCAA